MTISNILEDLISFKTDTKSNENLQCVDYICKHLKENNVLYKRLKNPLNQRENIIATLNTKTLQNIDRGLILSGHIDVVEAKDSMWQTPPFKASLKEDKIYGRGTVDMKYFISVVLSQIPTLKQMNYPIILLFSADEETDVEGIKTLTTYLKENNITPKYALIGEPTSFNICTAHNGYLGIQTTITGKSAHSSTPNLGINASYIAARLALKIEELNAIYKDENTTLNVGTINSGNARNIIADKATLDWDIRYKKATTLNKILEEIATYENSLQHQYQNAEIKDEIKETLPAFERMSNLPTKEIAKDLLNTQEITLPYATEAGFLQQLNIETLVIGAGDEKLAHTANEYIPIKSLKQYSDFLLSFAQKLQKLNQ